MERDLPGVPAHADHAPGTPLDALPVIDKAVLMGAFERYNRAGLDARAALRVADGSGRAGPWHVGASTGTSGNRGAYVISEAERFRWLGAILAKALPGFWRASHRVAVVLPRTSTLYTAGRSRRLDIRFIDIALGPDGWCASLEAFAPDVVIAPPKVLRHLAETGFERRGRIPLLYSAAETLDPVDRAVVEARTGAPLRQIYMATEGLIGVSCPHGTLHLAEDRMHVELEPVAGSDRLLSPIVTDFSRAAQIMARYRMNDLLVPREAPCPCGSPLRAIETVLGRDDDVFVLEREATTGATPRGPDRTTTGPMRMMADLVRVTPDLVRDAVVGADRRIDDYRVVQVARDKIVLRLPPRARGAAPAARAALLRLLDRVGARAAIEVEIASLSPDPSRKLRRVERAFGADGGGGADGGEGRAESGDGAARPHGGGGA